MDQKSFLARVLPAGNHYIAYQGDNKDAGGRPIWNHRSFVEPYEGVNISDNQAGRGKDVYFAIASYKVQKILDPKLGKEKSYRKQENVAALRSLFLDVDFKNYDSPEQATLAVRDFFNGSELEKPTIIVRTGGGLHIYWTFAESLAPTEWQPLANGLAGLAENLGLRADLQCTIDSARILRMPGTVNHKYDPPRLCEVATAREGDADLVAMRRRLAGVTSLRAGAQSRGGAPSIKSTAPIGFTVDPSVAGMFGGGGGTATDLTSGVGYAAEYSMHELVKGCPMMAGVLARGGLGDGYHLWNNTLLLSAYTTDGREFAHLMSRGDERYSAAQVDQVFDEKLRDKARLGPTSCATFNSCAPGTCATCPHFGKIKSPIVLGKPPAAEPAEAPVVIREPTFVENGYTWTYARKRDPEGNLLEIKVPLFSWAMDRPVLIDVPGEAMLEVNFHKAGHPPRRLTLACSKLRSREYLPSVFGGYSIPVSKETQAPLEEALMVWMDLLRDASALAGNTAPFGWVRGPTPASQGFAIAGNLYAADGEVRRSGSPIPQIADGYQSRGSEDPWRKMAQKLIDDPRTEMQLVLATAFAAPLIELTNLHSTAMVVRSTNSGVGKTSALRVARAVWGSPDDMSQANDTPTAVEIRLSALTNLPWYWDEMKAHDAQSVSNTVYQILQGQSKQRGTQNGGVRPTHKTHGMLVIGTNLSLAEIMLQASKGTDAGTYRIFELDLPTRQVRDASGQFDALMSKLSANHGHAGVTYAKYLAEHRDEVEQLMELVGNQVNQLYAAMEAERYWITTVKVLLAGAILAKRAGICNFDVPRMNNALKRTIGYIRAATGTINSGEELAGRIFRFFSGRTIITDRFYFTAYNPTPITVHQPALQGSFGAPRIRLAVDDNLLIISREGVEEFAKNTRQQAALLCDTMKAQSSLTPTRTLMRTSIDKGVAHNRGSSIGRESVYVLDASQMLGDEEISLWTTLAASRRGATPGSSSGSPSPGSRQP